MKSKIVRALLVRRERAKGIRESLLSKGTEFYEERDNFHFLFVFPKFQEESELNGKWSYLVDGDISEIETREGTFKIEGPRDAIDIFAPKFEKRGLKVNLDNPDNLIEIKRWGRKYLISVS